MTNMTQTKDNAEAISITSIVTVAAAGLFLVFFTGFAQATVLHDSAHDTRHTLAFPCH